MSASVTILSLFPGEYRVELLAGFYKSGALAQPFQFLGAGIGAGTAHSTEQIEDSVFNIATIGHLNFAALGGTVFLETTEVLVVGGA